MTTAAAVTALCRAYTGVPPSQQHLRALLTTMQPEEVLLWCGVYTAAGGAEALLAVTDRRIVDLRGGGSGHGRRDRVHAREIALDRVVAAVRERSATRLGLRPGSRLVVRTASETAQWEHFTAEQCAAIIAAVHLARTS